MHRKMGMPVKVWPTTISETNVNHQVWVNSSRVTDWLQPQILVQKILYNKKDDGNTKTQKHTFDNNADIEAIGF